MPRYRPRARRRKPNTGPTALESLCVEIQRVLYGKQQQFWYERFTKLIHGQLITLDRPGNPRTFGLHWGGRNWTRPYGTLTDEVQYSIMAVLPKFEEDARRICTQLAEIEQERKDVARFLAGLLLFRAPIREVLNVLGSEIVGELESKSTMRLRGFAPDKGDEIIDLTEFHRFVKQNKETLDLMEERLLANLILSGSLADKQAAL